MIEARFFWLAVFAGSITMAAIQTVCILLRVSAINAIFLAVFGLFYQLQNNPVATKIAHHWSATKVGGAVFVLACYHGFWRRRLAVFGAGLEKLGAHSFICSVIGGCIYILMNRVRGNGDFNYIALCASLVCLLVAASKLGAPKQVSDRVAMVVAARSTVMFFEPVIEGRSGFYFIAAIPAFIAFISLRTGNGDESQEKEEVICDEGKQKDGGGNGEEKKEKADGNEEVDSSCSTGASDNGKDWKMTDSRSKHEEEQATAKHEEDCGEWEKGRCFYQTRLQDSEEICSRLEEEKNSLTSQLSAATSLSELYQDILHDPHYEL